MSPIGRLFVVLNLILAGVFVGYSGYYLHNVDSYKKQLTETQKKMKATIQAKDSQIGELTSKLNSAKADLGTKTARVFSLEKTAKASEEEIKDLKAQNSKLNARLANIEASMSSVADTLEKTSKRNTELEKLYLAARDEMQKAKTERSDMADRLAVAEADSRSKDKRIDSLISEVRQKTEKVRDLETRISVAVTKVPGLGPILAGAVPTIDGRVVNYDPNLRLVTITTGKNQGPVKKGYTFSIHDGKRYKGEVSIIDVMEGAAVGRVTSLVRNASIRKGDAATTNLQ
ncbi:MAG TPA: hypothetical protein ENK02_15990 [Planctomycetes bacterium]|nr:hypothetical protein [Planctomycetota bacterium]